MKKSLIILIIAIIFMIVGSLLIFNKNAPENQVSNINNTINTTLNVSCNIDKVILNLSNGQRGYDADFVLKCNYKNQDVYYFGVGCCDRVTKIYNNSCNLLGSSGGFAVQTTGDFEQISENMGDCLILWYYPDKQNRSLLYANIVINRTNSA